jgi:hypothetical protein
MTCQMGADFPAHAESSDGHYSVWGGGVPKVAMKHVAGAGVARQCSNAWLRNVAV